MDGMDANTLSFALPQRVDRAKAQLALAAGLIYQGGVVTVEEAARLAGMERRVFIDAMRGLGRSMAEAIEDAIDGEASLAAEAEMEQGGAKPIPFEQLLKECGLDPNYR
jgi:hypothetical protein